MMKKHRLLLLAIVVCLLVCMFTACGDEMDADLYITVTFMVDGEVYHEIEVESDSRVILPAEPEKDGFTFDGWYLSEEYITAFTSNYLRKNTVVSDIMVYAKWVTNDDSGTGGQQPQEDGLVCFDANGGDVSITEKRYAIGAVMTDMPIPIKVGYDFVGWETASGESYTSASVMPDLNGETLWLYSKWTVSNLNIVASSDGYTVTGIKNITVTSIVVPEYVTEISAGAFRHCLSLESITIPFVGAKAGVTSSDTYQYPFGYIFGTSSYTGGTAVTQYYYGSSTESIADTTYYIPSTLRSVTVTGGDIFYGAFSSCSMLTSITIGDSVTSIGKDAFEGCSCLTSVTIGDSVTTIGWAAFSGCRHLTSVSFGEHSRLETIANHAFRYCSSLTSITIPNSVTTIGSDAFVECSSLTSITIPAGVTSIGNRAFVGCSSLTNILFEDTTDWYRTADYHDWTDKTGGVKTSVTDAMTNVTYFTSDDTYDAYYYWYKL